MIRNFGLILVVVVLLVASGAFYELGEADDIVFKQSTQHNI